MGCRQRVTLLYLDVMDSAETIQITVDGFPEAVPPRLNLARLLELRGESAKTTLIEHNGRYIRSTDLEEIELMAGDRVEIILPAFGG